MITMAQKQEILLAWHRGNSQRKIAADLGISRTTVYNYIRAHRLQEGGAGGLPDSGIVSPPAYDSSKRKRRSLSGEMCAIIDQCLVKNAQKRSLGLRKQCMKATDIHQFLEQKGYSISYSTLTGYLRCHTERRAPEAFIRREVQAGASVEFDWAEVKLNIDGQLQRLHLAVFTAPYSRHRFARLFWRQDMSSFLQAHVEYFSAAGAVASELVYDNMRTAVAKFARQNKEKKPTGQLSQLSVYYGFSIRFCNAARPNEKGNVERSVEYVRRRVFGFTDVFDSLAAANAHLQAALNSLNQLPASGHKQSIQSRFEEEQAVMRPAPPVGYDVGQISRLKVNKYACVKVHNNHYSVPDHLVGQGLDVKVYPDKILIYGTDNQLLARHERQLGKHRYFLHLDHYLITLSHKPAALHGSLTLQQADKCLRDLYHTHFQNEPKNFIELLIFIKDKQQSVSDLQKAIGQCLHISPHLPLCVDKIKFFLTEPQPPLALPKCAGVPSQKEHTDEQIAHFCRQQLQHIQALMG